MIEVFETVVLHNKMSHLFLNFKRPAQNLIFFFLLKWVHAFNHFKRPAHYGLQVNSSSGCGRPHGGWGCLKHLRWQGDPACCHFILMAPLYYFNCCFLEGKCLKVLKARGRADFITITTEEGRLWEPGLKCENGKRLEWVALKIEHKQAEVWG